MSLQSVALKYDALSSTPVTGTTPTTATINVSGSLTGEFENGYVFASQLPRSSTGMLSVTGAGEPSNQSLAYSIVNYPSRGTDVQQWPVIVITTSGGDLTVQRNQGADPGREYSVRYQPKDLSRPFSFTTLAASPYTETATDYTITLNNLVLNLPAGSAVVPTLSGTLNVGKPAGRISISGDTDFTPLTNTIGGLSESLFYDFRSNIPTGGSSVPNISVTVKRGAVETLSVISDSGKFYTCGTEANNPFVAQCSGGFSVSPDGRTLTFTNFKAGSVNNASNIVTLNGTLVSTGQ